MAQSETEQPQMLDDLVFFINGERHCVEAQHVDVNMTLLSFLRNKAGLTGTKLLDAMKLLVARVLVWDHAYAHAHAHAHAHSVSVSNDVCSECTERIVHRAVNACIAPLCSMASCVISDD